MQKKFTYSGVFKPYINVLKPYDGVFLQKKLESLKLESLRMWKCHIDLESLKLEFYAKKIHL